MSKKVAILVFSMALTSISGRSWGCPYIIFISIVPFIFVLLTSSTLLKSMIVTYLIAIPMFIIAYEGVLFLNPSIYTLGILFSPLPFSLVGALTYLLRKNTNDMIAIMMFPIAWVSIEFIISSNKLWGTLSNPISLGMSQVVSPFSSLAYWSGTSSITFIILIVNVCIYKSITLRSLKMFIIVIVASIFLVILTKNRINTELHGEKLVFSIIQGADNSFDSLISHFDDDYSNRLISKYLSMSNDLINYKADVLIWPESSLPRYFYNLDNDLRTLLPLKSNKLIISGGFRYSNNKSYNTIFIWRNGVLTSLYDKRAPAPIFENYLTRGRKAVITDINGIKIGLGICWDSLMADYNRENILKGAQILLFLTNDTFAKDTITASYHTWASSIVAVETGRYVIQASQSGPSAVFSSDGNLIGITPLNRRAILPSYALSSSSITPFVYYGNWVGWTSFVIISIVTFLSLSPVKIFKSSRIKLN